MTNSLQDKLFRALPIEQFRNPGKMQEPMTAAEQKAAGLIANQSKSIHGNLASKVSK